MKEIELSRGFVTTVDNEDYADLIRWKWYAWTPREGLTYAIRSVKKANGKQGNPVRMHRYLVDAPDGMQVDHKNGNCLDNRRSNLRICTSTQNQRNQHKIYGAVPYKGVRKNGNGYEARLRYNKKLIGLGTYKDPENAAIAYDKAAVKYFGEYACINKGITL